MLQTVALIRKLKRGFRTIRRRLFCKWTWKGFHFADTLLNTRGAWKQGRGFFSWNVTLMLGRGHRPLYSGYSFNPRLRGSRFVPPVMTVTIGSHRNVLRKRNHASSGFLEVVFKFKYLSEHRCTQIKISKRDDSGGLALLDSSMSFRIQDFDLA